MRHSRGMSERLKLLAPTIKSNRESEFVFAFRVTRLKFGRRLKPVEYNKGAFMTVGRKKDDAECVLVEDVNGADIKTAEAVPDVAENGNVYCVPLNHAKRILDYYCDRH